MSGSAFTPAVRCTTALRPVTGTAVRCTTELIPWAATIRSTTSVSRPGTAVRSTTSAPDAGTAVRSTTSALAGGTKVRGTISNRVKARVQRKEAGKTAQQPQLAQDASSSRKAAGNQAATKQKRK